jgi:hypothetical protein
MDYYGVKKKRRKKRNIKQRQGKWNLGILPLYLNGETMNTVTITGRELYKDGDWYLTYQAVNLYVT